MKLKALYRLFRKNIGYQGWAWWKIKHCFFNRHWSDMKRYYKKAWEDQWSHFWCGMCGGTHRFVYDGAVCTTINAVVGYEYIWRFYESHDGPHWRMYEGKQDVFIADDNLAKYRGTYEQKLKTEQEVWGMMFNNAYGKHKNGDQKIKGCPECKKSDVHEQHFKDIYLKAGWRE